MSAKEIIAAFVEAHNAHDVDRMMSYLAEDSVMIDVAAPIPLCSKGDVRKLASTRYHNVRHGSGTEKIG